VNHDQTHTNKCLDNFFVGPKVYLGFKQGSQVMSPLEPFSCSADAGWGLPCIWPLLADRHVTLLTQPRKDMSDHFLNLMPLVSSYLSKAYQLKPWPCDLYDGHRNMLGAELTVSHRTSFIKFRLWPCLVHFIGPWSIWLSTCNHLYWWSISLYIVTLTQSISVTRDFLLVTSSNGVMTKTDGTAMKPRASCGCTHMVALLGTRWYHR
jgi:hypothetical protein